MPDLPPKPVRFDPEIPPPGYETKLVTFWRDRPVIHPRLQLVHTNWANREGTVEAAWNWAMSAPGVNTLPHFQVDRSGRAAMLLPVNRKGTANYKANDFSIGFETADRGKLTDPDPVGSWFTDAQAEAVAVGLAYCAWGFGIPLVYPERWDGAGTACHTEPFGYPYWTNTSTKRCPGDRKKQQMREVVMPRARQIVAAWTAPPVPPTPSPPEEDDMALTFIAVSPTGSAALVSHDGAGVTFSYLDDRAPYIGAGVKEVRVSAGEYDRLSKYVPPVRVVNGTVDDPFAVDLV